jgi:hypothetical protein
LRRFEKSCDELNEEDAAIIAILLLWYLHAIVVERIVVCLILFSFDGQELLNSLGALLGDVLEKFVSNTNTSVQSLLGLWQDSHY